MPTARTRLAAAIASALLLALLLPAGPRASGTPEFAGAATDTIGNLLEGVEILVVAGTASVQPEAIAHSDAKGRFQIAGLAPGAYRIAALKRGYLTFVGPIDTRVQSWIDIVLHPAAVVRPGDTPRPVVDSRWPLRVPRRSILRETEAVVAVEPGRPPVGPSVVSDESLSFQVDQLFSVGASVAQGDEARGVMHGSETRLALASAIGDAGNLRLKGSHEIFENERTAGESQALPSRDASSFNLAFTYDTGPDARLSMNAFFDHRDLQWGTPSTEMADPIRRRQRTFGYDARWSKQLDPSSRVALRFDYQDTRSRAPFRDELQAPLELPIAGATTNRAMAAEGSYELLPGKDHQVQVAFRARALQLPGLVVAGLAGDPLNPTELATGYTVGVDAQDTWYVTGPFSLLYGMGYRHAIAAHDTSMVVPRLGGVANVGGVVMRFLASYHAVTDWTRDSLRPSEDHFRPVRDLGYDAQLDIPLPGGVILTGAASYQPIQLDFLGYDGTRLHPELDPTWVTDGNADVKRNRVSLVRDNARTQTYFEISNGRASGTLAAVLPYEMPDQNLALRNLRFENGRLGVRFHSTGTHLNLEYRTVEEWAPGRAYLPEGSYQRSVELGMIQDLMRMRSMGSWRLLMALKMATLRASDADPSEEEGSGGWGQSPSGQLRAGLSVVF